MKKLALLLLAVLLAISCTFTLTACGTSTIDNDNNIVIPDVSGLDENTCKTLLASKGLIPKVVYEYDWLVEEGLVVKTTPNIGENVKEDDIITVVISKGPSLYYLKQAVGYMKNISGIDAFSWGDNGEEKTKGFFTPYVEEGYLHIEMYLKCYSNSKLEFYGSFGTASINDSFDKTVPIEVIYSSKSVDNKGAQTDFSVKIPLSDLSVKKPTNIYIKFDFTVNGTRQTFESGFDLSW